MQSFLPTFVIRHRKENLSKCSLSGLEIREDFYFATYPISAKVPIPNLDQYVMLAMDAPPLSKEEAHLGLIVVDATWRYAAQMMKQIEPAIRNVIKRSIPGHYRTAYPRRQNDCPDPECGLASIEAIYIAYALMGRDVSGLLDHYHWKTQFLEKNGF